MQWLAILVALIAVFPAGRAQRREVNCNVPAEVFLALDGSDSVKQNQWTDLLQFISKFIDSSPFSKNDWRIGALTYSSRVTDVLPLLPFNNKAKAKKIIENFVQPRAGTTTATAIEEACTLIKRDRRKGAPAILVVVTDGRSDDTPATEAAATDCKKSGIKILAVGIGQNVFLREIRRISSDPQNVQLLEDFSKLSAFSKVLRDIICVEVKTTKAPSTAAATTKTPSAAEFCDGSLIDKGFGYNPYLPDCSKFIQCFPSGPDFKAVIRDCPHGEFWSQKHVTCIASSDVNCRNDPCRNQKNGFTFADDDNCRGYWICQRKRSIGLCCKKNSSFRNGRCRPDSSCKTPCPGEQGPKQQSSCLLKATSNKNQYLQNVPGLGEIRRMCAPGTVFDQKLCTCIHLNKQPVAQPQCVLEADFKFNGNFEDSSGKHVAIGVVDVELSNSGTAVFNGATSELNIWRFSDVDFRDGLVIEIKFKASGKGGNNQALLTNSEYGTQNQESPSVAISTNRVGNRVTLLGATDAPATKSFNVPTSKNGFNTVTYIHDGSELRAIVNNNPEEARQLTGTLLRRQTGFMIGGGMGFDSFQGEIDNIKVYLCIPDKFGGMIEGSG